MTTPNYLPILVPALGLMVPFLIRWIENKSRLSQARHLLQVIQTRDEINQMLKRADSSDMHLLENEAVQLRYFQTELEKEIKRNRSLDIRLYPILISIELVFFISAVFMRAISFLENLIYAQGNQTLPFLEGIFSNSGIRIGILIFCVGLALYGTHGLQKRIEFRRGSSIKTDLLMFVIFNFVFSCIVLLLGLTLFWLDWVFPWF